MSRNCPSILIVDDDEAIRGLLSATLNPSYWCATASSAEEAIGLLESQAPLEHGIKLAQSGLGPGPRVLLEDRVGPAVQAIFTGEGLVEGQEGRQLVEIDMPVLEGYRIDRAADAIHHLTPFGFVLRQGDAAERLDGAVVDLEIPHLKERVAHVPASGPPAGTAMCCSSRYASPR